MHTIPGAFQRLQQLYADGEARLAAGDLEGAVACFTEGIGIDDHFRQRYVTMYAQRAFALQKLGRVAEAIADYGKALELGEPPPNQAQYFFHRAMCWTSLPAKDDAEKRANVERAVADHGRSLELFQEHPGPWHLRGKLRVYDLGDFAGGLADLDRTLAFRENADARMARGFALYSLHRLDEARADYERVAQSSQDPYVDYMLACIHAKQGNEPALVHYAQRAIAADAGYRSYFAEDEEFAPYRGRPELARLLA
jgi:tetratricopeptide (TPR) repeat protein